MSTYKPLHESNQLAEISRQIALQQQNQATKDSISKRDVPAGRPHDARPVQDAVLTTEAPKKPRKHRPPPTQPPLVAEAMSMDDALRSAPCPSSSHAALNAVCASLAPRPDPSCPAISSQYFTHAFQSQLDIASSSVGQKAALSIGIQSLVK